MSRQIESSHVGVSRGVSGEETSARNEERVRESVSRPSSGRVVSAVGAVLKRPHTQVGSGSFDKHHSFFHIKQCSHLYLVHEYLSSSARSIHRESGVTCFTCFLTPFLGASMTSLHTGILPSQISLSRNDQVA